MAPYTSTADQAAFIWNIADLLRGRFKQADYGKVILPFTILRRLDCVLRDTRAAVLAEFGKRAGDGIANLDPFLTRKSKLSFYNTSPMDFAGLLDDPANVQQNLEAYVAAFSANARDIFERFKFGQLVADLARLNLLYKVVQKFATVDLHPAAVSNHDMGLMFENLIRRFAELSNETAGEHYTPREVIRLMVDILFAPDEEALTKAGVVRSFYDPTAGTGGILSVAEEHVLSMNPAAKLVVFGQEMNAESYAICKADLLIKGQDAANIVLGNTLSEDGHGARRFDYMGANPPYGVKWEDAKDAVEREHERKGFAGRFGPGLPRINDGSLLFLLHMIAKMDANGSRIGIVFSGSPLFSGDAGSGESEIRKWIVENDWLETIVALPKALFYNTAIGTYIWIVTNRKAAERRGRVQLIDARGLYAKMPRSLGDKRHFITDAQIEEITRAYGTFEHGGISKIFRNEDFGYRQITVERPLRLSYQATPERVARFTESSAFGALGQNGKRGSGPEAQEAILLALGSLDGGRLYMSRSDFEADLDGALHRAGVKIGAPVRKALLGALGERAENAEPCRDSKGRLEADSELRDTENVPLLEDVSAYFAREVLPHVPDAWIAEEKERTGYEIPFTQHFRQPDEDRPIAEIVADILTLETRIGANVRAAFA